MKVLHIENSYNIWHPDLMYAEIVVKCYRLYNTICADIALNRSYFSMYVEWWLHNIGYYLTLPFVKNEKIKALNERFKHLDLEEHKR